MTLSTSYGWITITACTPTKRNKKGPAFPPAPPRFRHVAHDATEATILKNLTVNARSARRVQHHGHTLRVGRVTEWIGTDRAWPDTEVRILPRPPIAVGGTMQEAAKAE